MLVDELLSKLPSHYAKDPDSNNYMAFSLVARGIREKRDLYATIRKYWDVDQAEGKGLDRLGKDEGISRGSYDDATYRKMIKIQYLVNMSEGDIEAINTILTAYMGEDFLYAEEGWSSFLQEPAAILLNISKDAGDVPYALMQRVKSSGVRIYYATLLDKIRGFIYPKEYTFRVPYPVTGTFPTASVKGIGASSTGIVEEKIYANQVPYPVTGTFACAAERR